MADPSNIYRIEYEVDLRKIEADELKILAEEMVKRLMDAASANRGGGASHERQCHDKVHGKWG